VVTGLFTTPRRAPFLRAEQMRAYAVAGDPPQQPVGNDGSVPSARIDGDALDRAVRRPFADRHPKAPGLHAAAVDGNSLRGVARAKGCEIPHPPPSGSDSHHSRTSPQRGRWPRP
jgi:hypothetical protein